jgi:hypothetical protein
MFCIHCGCQVVEGAKFCQGCGKAIPGSQPKSSGTSTELTQPTKEELLTQSQKVTGAFESETWLIELIKKKWPKSYPENFDQKVVGRFNGKLLTPDGQDIVVLFTDRYLALIIKGSPMGWPMPSFVHVHPRDTVKLVQMGTANYIHTSGAVSQSSDFWTLSLILENEKELPIIFLPLGSTTYQQQKNSEIYSAKISVLGEFWPVSLDGGHINKSGGYSLNLGVGFWYAAN